MREKIFEIISKQNNKTIWLGNKKVFVEERFGERKNIIKKYRITSIYVEDGECMVSYILIDSKCFIHTSYVKDLSNTFIAQILVELT